MTEQSDLGTIKGGGIGVLITQDTARFALMVVFFAKDCLALDTSSYCGGFRSLASCECGLAPDEEAVKEHNKSVLTILSALLKSVHFQIIKLAFSRCKKPKAMVSFLKQPLRSRPVVASLIRLDHGFATLTVTATGYFSVLNLWVYLRSENSNEIIL